MLEMEALGSSETFVATYRITNCHIQFNRKNDKYA